jgi:hypothetical protein
MPLCGISDRVQVVLSVQSIQDAAQFAVAPALASPSRGRASVADDGFGRFHTRIHGPIRAMAGTGSAIFTECRILQSVRLWQRSITWLIRFLYIYDGDHVALRVDCLRSKVTMNHAEHLSLWRSKTSGGIFARIVDEPLKDMGTVDKLVDQWACQPSRPRETDICLTSGSYQFGTSGLLFG